MKRISLFLLGAAFCTLLPVSCTRDSAGDGGKGGGEKLVHIVFSASSEAGKTRTTIDRMFVEWMEGDTISVIDAAEPYNHKFGLISGAGSNSATFGGEAAESGPYRALYPYTTGATIKGDTILNVFVPDSQIVVSECSIDPRATIMACRTNSKDSLNFVQYMSYIKVTPKSACNKVTLKGIAGGVLAGTGEVRLSDTTFAVTSGGVSRVVLTGADSAPLEAGKDYYIAVCPGTLAGGIEMKFEYDTVTFYSADSTSVTLKRGTVYNAKGGGTEKVVWQGSQKITWDSRFPIPVDDWSKVAPGTILEITATINTDAETYACGKVIDASWIAVYDIEWNFVPGESQKKAFIMSAEDINKAISGGGLGIYGLGWDLTKIVLTQPK